MSSRPGSRDETSRFRSSSPAAIAAVAGFGGVLCGALVVAMLARPAVVTERAPVETTGTATTTTTVATTQAAVPPVVSETPTPATEETARANATADCDRQAWPYITPQCQAEREADRRKVRVITTDKLAAPLVDAIETARVKREAAKDESTSANAAPPVPMAAAASPEPLQALPQPRTDPPIDQNKAAPPSAAQPAALQPADLAPETAAAPESKRQRAVAKDDRKEWAKSARDQRKRDKARMAPPPRPVDDDDDDDDTSSTVNSTTTRTVERENSNRRVMERWTEREYDVPSYNGSRRRRVIVIRPSPDEQRVPFLPSAGGYSRSIFQY